MSVFRCSIRFIDQKLWFDGCRIQSDYYTQYLHEEQVDLLRPICDTLSQLGQYIDLQSDRITLPTYHHRSSRPWQAFIAGGWFEYLVAQWLRDGSEPIEVETNLQLHDRPKNSRDADLIIRYKHQLMVIELKADWHNFNAASDQLESLKNTSKAKLNSLLLFSPQAYWNVDNPDSIHDRVVAANSRIGLAIDKESVVRLITQRGTNWQPYEKGSD